VRSDSFVDPHTRVPGQPRSEGIVHGSHRPIPFSPCSENDFVDHSLLGAGGARGFRCVCRGGRSCRDNISTMNGAIHGRRLARPVRLTLASQLGDDVDGAWWPHTASIARELPELMDALFARLGEILDISVNWSSLEGSPDLDALNRASAVDPGRVLSHQRLMTITGSHARANLLLVPSRTSSVLAVTVLRQAAALPATSAEQDTKAFRTATDILCAARAESAQCARRLQRVGTADFDMPASAIRV
jgi:Family of unknown function (DUF5994)